MLRYSDKSIFKVFICFLFILPLCSLGQVSQKEFNKKLKSANDLFAFHDFKNSLTAYSDLAKIDSSNGEVLYKLGASIFKLRKDPLTALPYFKKAWSKEVKEAGFYIGYINHLNGNFDEAIMQFKKAIGGPFPEGVNDSIVYHMLDCSMYAKKAMLKKSDITIENMGPVINSAYPDYVPLISADETVMIFTSRRDNSTAKLLDPNGEYFEDIYISNKENNTWSIPTGISGNINTKGHDACVALSADGEQLILYRTSEDLYAGDLYISSFNGKDWTVPVLLGSDINTEEGVEPSASLSADNNSLYFSSDRPGGYGGKDIYRVVKLPDGTWSKASNLGPIINTATDEDAPFIHPDGRTLYFSSRGHQNMGEYDIFKTSFDDEENRWLMPTNMGYPINTVDNDIYFVLSVDGKTGYYSSNKKSGIGSTDIYKIKIPDENFNLVAFNGMILSESNEPIAAKVTLTEEGNKDPIGIYKTNKLTGKYLLILPPGHTYTATIEAEGYTPFTGKADFSGGTFTTKLKKMQSN